MIKNGSKHQTKKAESHHNNAYQNCKVTDSLDQQQQQQLASTCSLLDKRRSTKPSPSNSNKSKFNTNDNEEIKLKHIDTYSSPNSQGNKTTKFNSSRVNHNDETTTATTTNTATQVYTNSDNHHEEQIAENRSLNSLASIDSSFELSMTQSFSCFNSFLILFRFSTVKDKFLIIIGILFAVIEGCGLPLMSIVFGNMSNTLVRVVQYGFENSTTTTTNSNITNEFGQLNLLNNFIDGKTILQTIISTLSPYKINYQIIKRPIERQSFESLMTMFAIFYILIGAIVYISLVIQYASLQTSCERQVHRIKKLFFISTIRQELSWFDKNIDGNSLASNLNEDIERIRDGLGEQLCLLVKQSASFIAGFFVGFVVSWKLTLVTVATIPFLGFLGAYTGKVLVKSLTLEQDKSTKAAIIAEEIIVSIRTVFSLNGQKTGLKSYKRELDEGKRESSNKYLKIGFTIGASLFVLYCADGFALYLSSLFVERNELTPGAAVTVIMSSLIAATSLSGILPPMQVIAAAIQSARTIFCILDSKPSIDIGNSENGIILTNIEGNIEFKDVWFSYPRRKCLPVIQNLNIKFKKGYTVAICGKTGSGKSTIINLLLRFYDPTNGCIYLDNCNLVDLNVNWLRSLIGIVEQEPALFDCTIAENIALGSTEKSQQTMERILYVSKLSNAHEFIVSLPDGYQTRCGDRGYQMSGGQKQRIAIARALLSDPKILLLDEATSALDSESEFAVQTALNKARKGRTTIIVAHRLSTIKESDLICVMDGGKLVESGKHDELIELKGFYYNLITSQVFETTASTSATINTTTATTQDQIQTASINQSNSLIGTRRGGGGGGVYARRNTLNDDSDSDFPEMSRQALALSRSLKRTGSSASSIARRRFKTQKELTFLTFESFAYNSSCAEDDELGIQDYSSNNNLVNNFIDRRQNKQKANFNLSKNINNLSIFKIYPLIKPEIKWVIACLFISCLSGFLNPIFGLVYAEIFDTLTKRGNILLEAGKFWSELFVGLAFINLLMTVIRTSVTAKLTDDNTTRLRFECLKTILQQPVGWFDEIENSPQRLTARLTSDVPIIKSIVNARIISLLSGFATVLASLCIAYAINWQMSFLLTLVMPVLFYVGYLQINMTRNARSIYMQRMEDASRLAIEAIENVKLIQAMQQEQFFVNKFLQSLKEPLKLSLSSAIKLSLAYGLSQSAIYFVYAAAFRFGGYLIANEQLTPINMFRVFFSIVFTAIAVGQMGALGSDMTRAKQALINVNNLLNVKSAMNNLSAGGIKPRIQGTVVFENVYFRYPTRSETLVLGDLSLSIEKGTTLALVGVSGSGKSTLASLLLRFYDPEQGSIRIDNYDLRSINLEHLRRNVCIVSQEPTLFRTTIKENILFGLDYRDYSMHDIITAAKLANIDDFIQNLPDRYNTILGDRGTQLSAGQKQRIAIARAIIRDPAILILDEATSALDSENEALVNQAFNFAVKGKTCIKIAHRLSTIRESNKIAVIDKGRIVELGTHDELMAIGRRGYYYKLMQKQEIYNNNIIANELVDSNKQ